MEFGFFSIIKHTTTRAIYHSIMINLDLYDTILILNIIYG